MSFCQFPAKPTLGDVFWSMVTMFLDQMPYNKSAVDTVKIKKVDVSLL